MPIMSNGELVQELIKALGLPKRCRWFELRAATNEPVTVRCEYLPEPFELEPEAVDVTNFLGSAAIEKALSRRGVKAVLAEYTLVPTGGSIEARAAAAVRDAIRRGAL